MIRQKLHPHHKLTVAITGGIGCGKTFVLNCFKKLGFATFSADEMVNEIYRHNQNLITKIKKLFPSAVANNCIDKKKLGEIVFQDPNLFTKLEKIIHPLVKKKRQEIVDNNNSRCLIFEIPLLFETKQEKDFDAIISIICPEEIQKNRVLQRNYMTAEKFDVIFKKQVVDAERIKKSDFLIFSGNNIHNTFRQIKRMIH